MDYLIKKDLSLSDVTLTAFLFYIHKLIPNLNVALDIPMIFFDAALTFCSTEMVSQQSISLSFISFSLLNERLIGLKKYVIIFILSTIELFLFIQISPYVESFVSNNLFWFMFSITMLAFVFLMVNLILMFLVINFATKKTKILNFPKYTPNFIKNYLIQLRKFSRIRILYDDMLNLHIRYAIIFSVLLLLTLILLITIF